MSTKIERRCRRHRVTLSFVVTLLLVTTWVGVDEALRLPDVKVEDAHLRREVEECLDKFRIPTGYPCDRLAMITRLEQIQGSGRPSDQLRVSAAEWRSVYQLACTLDESDEFCVNGRCACDRPRCVDPDIQATIQAHQLSTHEATDAWMRILERICSNESDSVCRCEDKYQEYILAVQSGSPRDGGGNLKWMILIGCVVALPPYLRMTST